MPGCDCSYNVLLLNPAKKHSKKEVKRNYKRVNNIIKENITLFDDTTVKIVKQSLEVICKGAQVGDHSCDIVELNTRLIKHRTKLRKAEAIQEGSKSTMALVAYYPEDNLLELNQNNEELNFSRDPEGALHPVIPREFIQEIPLSDDEPPTQESGTPSANTTSGGKNEEVNTAERDQANTNDDNKSVKKEAEDIEVLEERKPKIKNKKRTGLLNQDNKRVRFSTECNQKTSAGSNQSTTNGKEKKDFSKLEDLLQDWIAKNRRADKVSDEIEQVIGHWYRYERPKFKCIWKGKKGDTSETVEEILVKLKNNVKPLTDYLRSRSDRTFDTIVERAPDLIAGLAAIEQTDEGNVSKKK